LTKLDYRKVAEPDPARVTEVRESGVWSGNDDRPFEMAAQRQKRRAQERAVTAAQQAKTAARSEIIRYKAIIKKFGPVQSVIIGVPLEFVQAQLRAQKRSQQKQEREAAKLREQEGG
jgi:hypothetical protein